MDTENKEKILILTATALAGALAASAIKRGLSRMRLRFYWEPTRPEPSDQNEREDDRHQQDAWAQIQEALASESGPLGDLGALDSLLSSGNWMSANGPGRVSLPPDPPPSSSNLASALMPGAGGFLNSKDYENLMPRPTGLSPATLAKEANSGMAA